MNNETKRTGWRSALRLCAASLALAAGSAWAEPFEWIGDGTYSTASNWSPEGFVATEWEDLLFGESAQNKTVSFDCLDNTSWTTTIKTGSTASPVVFQTADSEHPEYGITAWWLLHCANTANSSGALTINSGTYKYGFTGNEDSGNDSSAASWAMWGANANANVTITGSGILKIYSQTSANEALTMMSDSNSHATLNISGNGYMGLVHGDMNIGFWCDNTCSTEINISENGTLSCGDDAGDHLKLGAWAENCHGTIDVNLSGNGCLEAWNIIKQGDGTSRISFDGGTIRALGVGTDGGLIGSGISVTFGSKGGTIDSAGNNVTIAAAVTGVGTITKKGTGTLTFSGDMSGFIGKVAVANGAGDVILPATASRARPGDYTAKTENQDGTFTFSYDSSSAPAATQYAELYRLDFQDDSTTGWSFSQYAGETANFSIKTRTLVQKDDNDEFLVSKGLMVKTEGNANGNRGVKGTYTIPDEVKRADNYVFEFDWFATENTKKTSDNTSLDLGLYVYASDNSEVVRLISNPVVKANKVQVFLNGASVAESEELDAAPANNYRTDNNDIDCDGTHNQDKWYHVMLTANETAGLTLKILKNDLTTVAFPETRVCDFVNLGKLVLDIYRARSSFQISGGIDDLIATTPAVAGVDGVNYATFASAVAAATSTSKITLYSDVELTASVELPYGATLDLNGYALYTTDTDVDVTFNDGIHYLASTTAGGYKTFSNVVAVFDTVYVWVGENGGAWATSTNWQLAGVTTHGTLPAYNSIVLIPGGDGTEMVIKCPDNYAANAYTGYLSIERDVRLQPSNNRRANQGIHLTKVSGTGTLILEGWTTENNGYYYLNIYAGDSSISKMEVDCDLCVKGYVYFPNSGSGNNKWSRALQLNGSLSGDGSIAFNTQANQPGFLFYGDTTKFEGSYSGGGRNDWNRDGTRFVGASSIGSELAYWKFGVEQNSSSADIGWPLNKAGEYEFGRLDAPYFRAHASGITVKVGNLAGTSTINGKLEYSANKIVKVGDSSTLNLTLTESVGTVEVEAGTLNLLGTVAPTALTMTGEGAIATVVEGNSAVPTLASTLSGTHDIKTTPGDGITTYKVVPLVEPGEAAATTYETAEAATAAAADVVVAVPTAVAAELTTTEQQAAYKDMFEAKAVETSTGSGVWQVTVDFTAAAEAEIKAAEDAISVVDGATPKVTVTAKPGLYYFVKAGTAADSLAVDGTGTLATGDSVTLDMPLPDSGVKYYKVVASPTETL